MYTCDVGRVNWFKYNSSFLEYVGIR